MTWTPETNRIPFGLLTDEEKAAHWHSVDPSFAAEVTYRAKRAPKRIVMWLHWDKKYGANLYDSETGVIEVWKAYGGWVKRIECNEDGSNMIVTDEVL